VPLPEPRPGLVIRYDYLWTREAAAGRDQGKERPACLVAAMDIATSPRFVVILPITHTRPDKKTVGVEIPAKVRKTLGLDDAPSWVIVSEHNVDEWPNAGLAPLPGRPGVFSYGFIPPGLFAQVKSKFLELCQEGRSGSVQR
jgi:PemK-like, MazF-like toxin of type II toxin-antitoxin system